MENNYIISKHQYIILLYIYSVILGSSGIKPIGNYCVSLSQILIDGQHLFSEMDSQILHPYSLIINKTQGQECFQHSGVNLSTYKSLSLCCLHVSRTAHLNFFTLGKFVAEDQRKSSEFGAIQTRRCIQNYQITLCCSVQQWRCDFSALASWLCRLKLGSQVIPLS